MAQLAPYEQLVSHARETALLYSIQGLVYWDEQTYLPAQASPYRAEQAAYLAGTIHRRRTDPQLGEWLAQLQSDTHLDPDAQCNARELKRRYDKAVCLPSDLVEQIARTASESHRAWAAARQANDFAAFQPWLEKMLALRQEQAEAIGYATTPYDALLDEYEPGATAAQIGPVLSGLRDALVPWVEAIAQSEQVPDASLLKRSFSVDQQEAFGKRAAEAIGFDFTAGRLDVTTHPFCGGAGPRDVRLTTRYQENDFGDGFFSILHEAGHGIYEQGLEADAYGLPTGEAISLGIHESQSRLWENLVGRSHGFWRHFYEPLCQAFPQVTDPGGLDAWYAAVNVSRPSLIRTESDEVTYNLHIVVRYELEKALVEGELSVADLPAAWNDAYATTLGVVPDSDDQGVLQDVHWSEGMFGYFPTYALGNLYAAQLGEQAEKELGDLDSAFAQGEFAPLLGWLREKVHKVGQRQSAGGLIESLTGAPPSHEPLIRHVRKKFGELYRLDGPASC